MNKKHLVDVLRGTMEKQKEFFKKEAVGQSGMSSDWEDGYFLGYEDGVATVIESIEKFV